MVKKINYLLDKNSSNIKEKKYVFDIVSSLPIEYVFKCISSLDHIEWTEKLIDEYIDLWDWEQLSSNTSLPWTLEFIEKYKDKWKWEYIKCNESLPWSLELIKKFDDYWYWETEALYNIGFSDFEHLPWSLDIIESDKDLWNWDALSSNKKLPWSLELIEKYKNLWNWSNLSINEGLPWSITLIDRYKDLWNWFNLSGNESLPWSFGLIEKYKDLWNWRKPYHHVDGLVFDYNHSDYPDCSNSEMEFFYGVSFENLSKNPKLPWSNDFVIKYQDYLDWNWMHLHEKYLILEDLVNQIENPSAWNDYFSLNENLPWSIDFLMKYLEKWNWNQLLKNPKLPWCEELTEIFHKKLYSSRLEIEYLAFPTKNILESLEEAPWNFHDFSETESYIWSSDLIEKFKDYWSWSSLSTLESLPWSLELIEKFKDYWDWYLLSGNIHIPFSIDLIENFTNYWDWSELSKNKSLPCSKNFLIAFKDLICWPNLMKNKYWCDHPSPDLLECFMDLCFENFYLNKDNPFAYTYFVNLQESWLTNIIDINFSNYNLETIYKYKNFWDWSYFTGNKYFINIWLKLSGNDIEQLMKYHFSRNKKIIFKRNGLDDDLPF